MCEEILEINLSQVFTIQTYMLLKVGWDTAFTCGTQHLPLVHMLGKEKRSSYVG